MPQNLPSIGALSVDVEEYFQVEAFKNRIQPTQWRSFESRLRGQMEQLLSVFSQFNCKATFFTLGWIAKHYPELIHDITQQGHELASHGDMHQHLSGQSQTQFRHDIISAKKRLEDISGHPVLGYRAPCFSIAQDNPWAHDEIYAAGYRYSSSSYPIAHDNYGVPAAPRTPYELANGLLEIPISTAQVRGKTLPAGGGGYFRLMPYWFFSKLQSAAAQQLGCINFYTHPWEFDPHQPRIKSSLKSSFRHHVNQKTALLKLQRLCRSRRWNTMAACYLSTSYPKLSSWQDVASGKF